MSTSAETAEICGMAVDIRQRHKTGMKLHKNDLWLLQRVVNDDLNVAGIERFKELYRIIKCGNYNIEERWKT